MAVPKEVAMAQLPRTGLTKAKSVKPVAMAVITAEGDIVRSSKRIGGSNCGLTTLLRYVSKVAPHRSRNELSPECGGESKRTTERKGVSWSEQDSKSKIACDP